MLIQSQNIILRDTLTSSLSLPAPNPLLWWATYLHYSCRGFVSLPYTYKYTSDLAHYFHVSDSNLLCVTLQARDSCLKRNQQTYTPPNDGRLRPHLTLHHLSIIPLSLLSHPSPPPLLFLSKTILHYIMTPMLLCFSRSRFYFWFQFSVPYWHNKNYTFVLPKIKWN